MATSVNRAPTVNKRFSTIFNQSPPDTPSLREQAFYVRPEPPLTSDLLTAEEPLEPRFRQNSGGVARLHVLPVVETGQFRVHRL